jgi:DNA-binding PadR family transcriptional regulator
VKNGVVDDYIITDIVINTDSDPVSDMPPRAPRRTEADQEPDGPYRTHGGGRGFLRFYILHLISQKPRHGYEIIQDIQAKTEGAWNPGAGSIYPVLKKLVGEGMIEAEAPGEVDDRHVYRITPKGAKHILELKEAFANFGQRWTGMRNMIMEMIDPERTGAFVLEGSKKQFEFMQKFVESKANRLPEKEMEYMLREYSLILERQQGWIAEFLKSRTSTAKPSARRRGS